MGRLDGKVALITGAARGQGEAEARHFVAEGATVALTDVLTEEGEAVAADIGDDAIFLTHDVTSEEAWSEAVERTVADLGGLDVLVNNAGIVEFAPMTETSADSFRRTFEVNQLGVFLGMKAVVPAMAERRRLDHQHLLRRRALRDADGRQLLGHQVRGSGDDEDGGARARTDGIRVNSVHPGIIDTPMLHTDEAQGALSMLLPRVPLGRVADASEVAPWPRSSPPTRARTAPGPSSPSTGAGQPAPTWSPQSLEHQDPAGLPVVRAGRAAHLHGRVLVRGRPGTATVAGRHGPGGPGPLPGQHRPDPHRAAC